jgi:hypothetical protein
MVNMADDVTDEQEEKPADADFFVPLPNGHKVWFKDFERGQLFMLQRAGKLMRRKLQAVLDGGGPEEEKNLAFWELMQMGNQQMWDAIDSRVVNKPDIEVYQTAFIAGEIDDMWPHLVLRRGEPDTHIDDDTEEVTPQAGPRRPAKRAANAKRTQVK